LVLDYLCEHSSGSLSTKSSRLDSARKQDVSILQSLNARLSVRAMSVYHLVAGTVSSCVLSILQSRRPLPDKLFQAVNTLMSSARYAPPAMRPSESSFTGYLVTDSGSDESPSSFHDTSVQLVIDNLVLNRVSFHFAFVLFSPSQSGVHWLCLVQLPRESSVEITSKTTLQDISPHIIIPFWIVLRVSYADSGSVCVDSWILTDRDDKESLTHSVKLHVEFALLHANQHLLMQRLLDSRKLPSLFAHPRSTFSSIPLPEATRFVWGKPVSQWPSGSCGCRILHHVVLEVHYRLDIGEALAQILSQSFLRPWKIDNASDVFLIGNESSSCVYAHVSKLEQRETLSLQRSTSPTLSTNNSIIIRFHGVSESGCVDLQPFCSAISQRLQALCVQNLLGIIQRNPALRLSREDVDLLADPASPPTKSTLFYVPVQGKSREMMKSRLAFLISRVFFRLRFLDRRPPTSGGNVSLRGSDSDETFNLEDGVVFRFVRVGLEGGRNGDAWRGKAMSRGVGGDAMSLALCRFSCTYCSEIPVSDDGSICQIIYFNSLTTDESIRFLHRDFHFQRNCGLLLECKMWIIGSMSSSVITSKVSSLLVIAAVESSCLCSVASLAADSDHQIDFSELALHILRVNSSCHFISSLLSSFKTLKFQWKLPLPSFSLATAFSSLCGYLSSQYNISRKIVVEFDKDVFQSTSVDSFESFLINLRACDDIIEEEAQWARTCGRSLKRSFIALFSHGIGSHVTDSGQFCIVDASAYSVTFSSYSSDGTFGSFFGDVAKVIDRILEWTFLRNTLLSSILSQKASLPIIEPIRENFSILVTPLGGDGISLGDSLTASEARADTAFFPDVDADGTGECVPLPLDEMQVRLPVALSLCVSFVFSFKYSCFV